MFGTISDITPPRHDTAVTTTVEVTFDGSSASVVTTIVNGSAQPVLEVELLRLSGLRLGPSWEDDGLYLPYYSGEHLACAARDLVDLAQCGDGGPQLGVPRVRSEGGRAVYELTYAGGASMPWLDVVDPDGGLYIGCHDPSFGVTVLEVSTEAPVGGGPLAGALDIVVRQWVDVAPGSTWTSPPVVVAAHGPDWRDGADIYRRWFDSVTPGPAPDAGVWWERSLIWITMMKTADGQVRHRFADLPEVARTAAADGAHVVAPFGWSVGGFDSRNPEFFPDLELGGPAAMRHAFGRIREETGLAIMSYLNARLFSLDVPDFEHLGRSWAALPDGQTLEQEEYGGREFAVMCADCEAWTDLQAGFGESLISEHGTSLVYYDQVAAGRPVRCRNAGHAHGHGSWNRAYRAFLADALARGAAHDPGVALSIEGAADLYAPHAVIQSDPGLLFKGRRFHFPELFRYTFPEAIIADLVYFPATTSLYDGVPRLPVEQAREALCRAVLNGCVLGVLDPDPDDPWWHEARELLRLRAAAGPWLARSRFRHTRGLEIDGPVDGRLFIGTDEGRPMAVVALANPSLVGDASAVLVGEAWAGSVARRICPDGSTEDLGPLSPGGGGSGFAFTVPAAPLSFVVVR
jgi:hypothetical protein